MPEIYANWSEACASANYDTRLVDRRTGSNISSV